ncbi:hypothetical protein BT93_C2394 [Corymbia citriodora subsp. variegata]|nr:hypothetical protein BT93_C2394 [Corymbia citriodora subsp. variegata]
MSTLLSDFFDHPFADPIPYNSSSSSSSHSQPQVDWKETPDAHIFHVDLPGFSKEDVNLQLVDGRAVLISGERKEEAEAEAVEKGSKWHCRERASASRVYRQFRLPNNAKVEEIKASMRDGVLTLTVPKDEHKKKKKKQPEHKAVEISGDGDAHPPPKGFGRFVCCKA